MKANSYRIPARYAPVEKDRHNRLRIRLFQHHVQQMDSGYIKLSRLIVTREL